MRMTHIWSDFVSLFFPNSCIVCKTPLITGEDFLCLSCLNRLPYTRSEKGTNPAAKIFARRPEIKSAHAFLHFKKGNATQKLIFSLKYYNNKRLGFALGRMAALAISRSPEYELPDVLIPVPLHKTQLKKRGYNQSEWIAKGFNSVINRSIDTVSLAREKKTNTQTRKNLYERMTGMETSFSLTNPNAFEGKHVLLIDDVITSGATLNACIEELCLCSKIEISVFTLSIAQ